MKIILITGCNNCKEAFNTLYKMEHFRVVDFYAPTLDAIMPKLKSKTTEDIDKRVWDMHIATHGLLGQDDFFHITVVLIYYKGDIK